MKRILYLSFYFRPDLSAGSFRNSTLVDELSSLTHDSCQIDVFTTLPNRYSSLKVDALPSEVFGNIHIRRISIPSHNNGMKQQIISFKQYFFEVLSATKNVDYDLVFASSSRLFTAYLAYRIASKKKIPLYLDIRDIFVDTLQSVLKNKVLKLGLIPLLKVVENKTFSYANHINLISEGFKPYFNKWNKAYYSYFTNGIDDIFLKNVENHNSNNAQLPYKITYAGNIGEGQGLHKIIPQMANVLGDNYQFIVIGDGGVKQKLLDEIEGLALSNVKVIDPVPRDELIKFYAQSDFLFMHLNDFPAFKKVLPSKVFELATFNKPIIAGVSGFAKEFISKNIPNSILFKPCDVNDVVEKLLAYEYKRISRTQFINEYSREHINKEMAKSIIDCAKL